MMSDKSALALNYVVAATPHQRRLLLLKMRDSAAAPAASENISTTTTIDEGLLERRLFGLKYRRLATTSTTQRERLLRDEWNKSQQPLKNPNPNSKNQNEGGDYPWSVIDLRCRLEPAGKSANETLREYLGFFKHIRFAKFGKQLNLSEKDLQVELKHAAQIVGHIRNTFKGQVFFSVAGEAMGFLFRLNDAGESERARLLRKPRQEFVHALIHGTFKNDGYVEQIGSAQRLDEMIRGVYDEMACTID